jgi:transposase
MNEATRKLALEKKKALSMERRRKALLLLEEGMSRREIAKTLGLSIGSVNVYCNGFKSPAGSRKLIDISNPDTNKPSSINKPIDTEKQDKNLVGGNWQDLLKKSIMVFIQESVENILKEMPIQDIIESEIIKALKNANVDFSTNNKAEKVKSKKKNPVPAIIVEENPVVDNAIEENPIEDTITIVDPPLSHQESETRTILMVLPKSPTLNLKNKAVSF